ncbi:type II toxin-antitoxin system HipA family toxin [Ghiorsea bivora]|uniref:type II toxin-antitoxin system HipA family toxin n=1 Tax=Ghiorsea bivora TaxID=1485545 RepID=UPI00056E58DF|nr:type II toxin-antitoxin system HipA family toxin [Ghiorsea bivora]
MVIQRKTQNRQALNVWMNGVLVGTWLVSKNKPQQFQYAESWLTHPSRRVLSLSMPFKPGNSAFTGDVVEHYFDNLLPDSEAIRQRIQQKFTTKDRSPFALLAEIGRDCVGAIQLLPAGEEPTGWNRIQVTPLSEKEVEKQLHAVVHKPMGSDSHDDFRISIAGAQEKTALTWHNNQWCLPLGATPTTHIFKLPLGLVGNMRADMSTSVENEWLCSKIMNAYDIPIASSEIAQFGDSKVLVVERFDRKLAGDGQYWLRLPQEDMCQALGKPPSLKYEADGGPGMVDILKLLRGSWLSKQDRVHFFKAQVLFWMLAATDGHAKNFSFFHEKDGMYRMTPIYDVLSAWPIMGEGSGRLSWHDAKLAMAFRTKNKHYKLKDVSPRHFFDVADKVGLGDEVGEMIDEILVTTPKVLAGVEAMLPVSFPQPVAESIFKGLAESADNIRAYMTVR